jgi:signal peptidase II
MAGKSSSGSVWPWLGVALIIFIADQFTKTLILGSYKLGGRHVPDQLLQHRAGPQHRRGVLVPGRRLGLAALVLHRHRRGGGTVHRLDAALARGPEAVLAAMACILGGAIGNVVDRLMHGYVVDFLDFHVGNWHFPAFNVADSAITIGAACLIVDELLRVRRGR